MKFTVERLPVVSRGVETSRGDTRRTVPRDSSTALGMTLLKNLVTNHAS
jgi:hypothetical protein